MGVVKVAGRSTDASLALAGSAPIDVTRILSPTTHLAATVVGICLALAVTRAGTRKTILTFLVPAIGITFFAYSRNALAIVAIAVLLTPLFERQFRAWTRVVSVTAGLVLAYFVAGWVLPNLADLPGLGYANRMYSAYANRVIGGISAETRQVDSSILYRQLEIRNMRTAISDGPLLGHGMGFSYQAQRDRNTPTSAYYGHQFYYWAVVKAGFVGVLVYLGAFVAPIFKAFKQPGVPMRSACAAAAVGLLYVSTVAPMPLSSNGGPLLGALLGIAATTLPRLSASAVGSVVEKSTSSAKDLRPRSLNS